MNKEEQHISELLRRFDEAQTTLNEERELEQYFASHKQVPPEWEPYKRMMAYFAAGMPQEEEPTKPEKHWVIPVWAWRAAAAAVVAGLVVAVALNLYQPQPAVAPAPQSAPIAKVEHKAESTPAPAPVAVKKLKAQPKRVAAKPKRQQLQQPAPAVSPSEVAEELAMMQNAAIAADMQRQLEQEKQEYALMQARTLPTLVAYTETIEQR